MISSFGIQLIFSETLTCIKGIDSDGNTIATEKLMHLISKEQNESIHEIRKNALANETFYKITYSTAFFSGRKELVMESGTVTRIHNTKVLNAVLFPLDIHTLNTLKIKQENYTILHEGTQLQHALNYFIKELFSLKNEPDVLWSVAKNICTVLQFEDCVTYLNYPEQKLLKQYAHVTTNNGKIVLHTEKKLLELPYGKGIVGTVPFKMKTIVVNNLEENDDYVVDDIKRNSEITVPIIFNGKLLGVIDSENTQKNFFTPLHEKILEGIALITAIKIIQLRNVVKIESRNKKLDAIFQNPVVGIFSITLDLKISYTNPTFDKLLGYEKAELLGESITSLVHKDYKKAHETNMRLLLSGKKEKLFIDKKYKTKQGEGLLCRGSLTLVSDAEKEDYILGLIEDVTEKQSVFDQNEELIKNLKHAVGELNDFAHVVSHDLKTPLRGIYTLVSWLIEDYKKQFSTDVHNTLHQILQRTAKMDELINGILQHTQISSKDIHKHEIDLDNLVRELLSMLDISKHFELDIPEPLPIFYGNRTSMIQLFQNLISNAIAYNDKEKGKLTIVCKIHDDYLNFQFSDNGKGIAEKYLKTIFGMFKTVENYHTSSGIGLSIVKKIVTNYKGTIYATSELGKGTTFHFTLKNVLAHES